MSLTSLKQVFERDKSGIISIRELDKHSRSRMLIFEVAKQYGYTPYYTRNSYKVNYYAHHTYITKHS